MVDVLICSGTTKIGMRIKTKMGETRIETRIETKIGTKMRDAPRWD